MAGVEKLFKAGAPSNYWLCDPYQVTEGPVWGGEASSSEALHHASKFDDQVLARKMLAMKPDESRLAARANASNVSQKFDAIGSMVKALNQKLKGFVHFSEILRLCEGKIIVEYVPASRKINNWGINEGAGGL